MRRMTKIVDWENLSIDNAVEYLKEKDKTLFDKITDYNNIVSAFDICIKNKKPADRPRYLKHREKIIDLMYDCMKNLTWQLNYGEPFTIQEKRKQRGIICCAFKDRVGQQAVLNICESLFVKLMIQDSYQAQKGKGIHKASLKIRKYVNELLRNGDVYFLHLDIKKYYKNINSNILIDIISRKIKCEKTIELFRIMLRGDDKGRGQGVTLGNNISQWLGNLYLYDYDHYFSSIKGIRFLRYADDMIFLSNDKDLLQKIRKKAKGMIHDRKLKLSMDYIGKITNEFCLDTLGFKFFLNYTQTRKDIKNNLSKAFRKSKVESMASLMGHTIWANSKKMLYNITQKKVSKWQEHLKVS